MMSLWGERGDRVAEKAYEVINQKVFGQSEAEFHLADSVPIVLSRRDNKDELDIRFTKDAACNEAVAELAYLRSLSISKVSFEDQSFTPKDSFDSDSIKTLFSICYKSVAAGQAVTLTVGR